LGVVNRFELSSNEVSSNEDAIQDLRFYTLDELRVMRGELETWSQIIVDYLTK
jgi:predicted NUDIX family phosphoesterase